MLLFERNKKGFYICTRLRNATGITWAGKPVKRQKHKTLEKWQSGRMRQS